HRPYQISFDSQKHFLSQYPYGLPSLNRFPLHALLNPNIVSFLRSFYNCKLPNFFAQNNICHSLILRQCLKILYITYECNKSLTSYICPMKKQENGIFGLRPVMEAIEAGKTIDKLFVQKGLQGEIFSELRKLIS